MYVHQQQVVYKNPVSVVDSKNESWILRVDHEITINICSTKYGPADQIFTLLAARFYLNFESWQAKHSRQEPGDREGSKSDLKIKIGGHRRFFEKNVPKLTRNYPETAYNFPETT